MDLDSKVNQLALVDFQKMKEDPAYDGPGKIWVYFTNDVESHLSHLTSRISYGARGGRIADISTIELLSVPERAGFFPNLWHVARLADGDQISAKLWRERPPRVLLCALRFHDVFQPFFRLFLFS